LFNPASKPKNGLAAHFLFQYLVLDETIWDMKTSIITGLRAIPVKAALGSRHGNIVTEEEQSPERSVSLNLARLTVAITTLQSLLLSKACIYA
jgi:hypothetical protein